MALAANKEVERFIDQELKAIPVAAASHIYKGALVALDPGGHARPLIAGDLFVGIAYSEADNNAGVDGDEAVQVYTLGDFTLDLPGSTIADNGRAVYATDDETLTLAPTGNSYVGRIIDVIAPGLITLRIDTLKTAP